MKQIKKLLSKLPLRIKKPLHKLVWRRRQSALVGRIGKVILPISLDEEKVKNAKVIINRRKQLELIPKGIVCAEVGAQSGEYAQCILDTIKPKKLFLIEISDDDCNFLVKRFAKEISQGIVEVVQESSFTAHKKFKDKFFDFIYIDAEHSYDSCKKDIYNFYTKLKDTGLMGINDYILYSHYGLCYYGVMHATNEFLMDKNWEIVYYTLNTNDYKDVVIRKITS